MCVEVLSKEELEDRINDEWWGSDVEFLDNIPDSDPNYWGDSVLIIKGSTIIPKAVETITRYKV